MRFETTLRMMKSLRSKSSSSATPAPRPMKTCRCTGSTALTRSPSSELSTGTSRQPSSDLALAGDGLLDDLLAPGRAPRRRAA